MKKIAIGNFEVVSGKIMVSDPCYEIGTWCQGTLKNVRAGIWKGYILVSDEGDWGHRVSELIAMCDGSDGSRWMPETGFQVGVDSGQAGIFDVTYYRDESVVLDVERISEEIINPDDPWYSICCDRTLSDNSAGVIPFGVVSSSGFGDGSYRCYTTKDESGVTVGIRIVFIDDEEADHE